MPPDRLLRIAVGYHLLVGLVFAIFPVDALASLALDPPRYWVLWYAACSGPLVMAGLLHLARRRADLRAGLVAAVAIWNLTAMAVGIFFVVWSELPGVLYGPAVAAGLWAWLLWGLYSEGA